VDLDDGQALLHPRADLLPARRQRLPRLAVPIRPDRPHQPHDLADHPIAELTGAAITDHTHRLGRLHIPTRCLTVHTSTLGDGAQTRTRHPPPQNLTNLDH